MEVFGPVIQGEGALAGYATHFVRFGGCDYRCSWCDTLYAVDPQSVREQAIRMSDEDILVALNQLPHAGWVTLSGGNPALQHLDRLVYDLHAVDLKVAVETQGTIWRSWLNQADLVTISPKPPSSGMTYNKAQLQAFYNRTTAPKAVKIVVFNPGDLEYAKHVAVDLELERVYLQPGNDVGKSLTNDLLAKLEWLMDATLTDPYLQHIEAVVLPQLHVLIYGNERGR